MTDHVCDLEHCDGTRLGHELALDFPEETARIETELARLRETYKGDDGLAVNAANLVA